MLYIGSYLYPSDNSGIIIMKCIHILGGSFTKTAKLGARIRISVSKLDRQKEKIQKKKIYNAVIVALNHKTRRKDWSFVKSTENRALVLNDNGKFLGTRVDGSICKEIRGGINEIRYKKIISYSGGVHRV